MQIIYFDNQSLWMRPDSRSKRFGSRDQHEQGASAAAERSESGFKLLTANQPTTHPPTPPPAGPEEHFSVFVLCFSLLTNILNVLLHRLVSRPQGYRT